MAHCADILGFLSGATSVAPSVVSLAKSPDTEGSPAV